MFRLLILVRLQGGFEGFGSPGPTLLFELEEPAVYSVPVVWVFGPDNLALSVGNVAFYECDPELFVFTNDLRRVLLDLSL